MNAAPLIALLALFGCLLGSGTAVAQANTPAAQIAELRRGLAAAQREQQQIRQQIAGKTEQLAALRNQPSPERDELRQAEAAVAEARANAKAAATPEAEARLTNAQFKLTLAERKYAHAHRDVEALSNAIAALEQQLDSRRDAATQLEQRIQRLESDAQRRLAAERKQRERQQRELEQTRREAESAQQEIARLKALLAEREQQNAATEAPAPRAEPTATARVRRAVATIPAAAQPPSADSTTAASGPVRLSDQNAVVAELRRLQQRLGQGDPRERVINEILYAKPRPDGAGDSTRITLHALSRDQFRGAAQLGQGDYQLVLGFDEWPLTLTAANAGATVFLLDRSGDEPRLLIYNERLEREAP